MGQTCYLCHETRVADVDDVCGGCKEALAAEDAAAVARGEPDAGKSSGPGDGHRRGRIPKPITLLKDQAKIYYGLQDRLMRRIYATNKAGFPEKGDEARLQGLALTLGRQIAVLADTMRKYEDEDRSRAKSRTPAEKFQTALAYLLSGKVTPAQRQEALEKIADALGKPAPLIRVPPHLRKRAAPLPEITPEDVEKAKAAQAVERAALEES